MAVEVSEVQLNDSTLQLILGYYVAFVSDHDTLSNLHAAVDFANNRVRPSEHITIRDAALAKAVYQAMQPTASTATSDEPGEVTTAKSTRSSRTSGSSS